MLPHRLRSTLLLLAAAGFLAGCGSRTVTTDTINSRPIRLPGGQIVRAEVMTDPADLMRGMKYRDSLPEGRGMLFVHGEQGNYRYWMYEVRVPLDLIWMDRDKRIVQVLHQAPPCPGPQESCKAYGGDFPARYVLELPAGTAKKYDLHPGQTLDF